MKKFLFSFFLLVCFSVIFSQTIPQNTRLMQLNSVKGSVLSLVESSDNFIYHVGTTNSSELGFDAFSYTNIGKDDLYILKSNNASGTNAWLKTFNAGTTGVISPKKVYIDSSENVYVFGTFSGSINAGSTSVTSDPISNAFLMKIDSSGNALWVNSFANSETTLSYIIQLVSDSTDLFMNYRQNHLVRIDTNTGSVIYDKTYDNGIDFRGLALQNSNIYLAGFSKTPVNFGSENILKSNTGFIIKGDKNANFTASMQTQGSTIGADVNYIAFASDGKLLLSGFSSSSTNLLTETGVVTYSYNPNTSFQDRRMYYYTAKIDSNLENVSFFRTSSQFSTDGSNPPGLGLFSTKIVPYGNTGNFKLLLYIRNRFSESATFTNSNSSSSTIPAGSGYYSLIVSSDSAGNSNSALNPYFYGFKASASANYYTQTTNNVRTFTTNVYSATDGNIAWTKQKSSSIGGTFSNQFVRHLNTEKNDVFFTSIVEGNANFFGKEINNPTGIKSRYVTRLGIDGLPKWFGNIDFDSGNKELNGSQDFACVDKDDNFLFLANTNENSSMFTDALGNTVSLQKNSKILVKLNKDGKLIWTKQMIQSNFDANLSFKSAIITDLNGDVYLLGINENEGFNLDGNSIPRGIFVIKLDATLGTIVYSKSYSQSYLSAYSLNPAFDAQNNLYVFLRPFNYSNTNYNFDGIDIPTSADNSDYLMLKFNSAGNVIFGKNFYANAIESSYVQSNDVVFDGTNFIVSGFAVAGNEKDHFNGLDSVNLPKIYNTSFLSPFLASIGTDGTVLWQNVLNSNTLLQGNTTNIGIDENKNFYQYLFINDKININGVEYSLDAKNGNKVLVKFNKDGNLVYSKIVDEGQNNYPLIDVIENDKINVTSTTSENNLLNYPVRDNLATNMYIATFGNLTGKYLTPENNYLEISSINISNNSLPAKNEYSFDLINNVDWSASSDQSWLNLSFLNLTGRSPQNTIGGNGDAKITFNAAENSTGIQRNANVMISGTGVSSKTVIVSQTSTLKTGESKISLITLYPNPTSDYLNIKTDKNISKVEFFDMSGKRILNSKLENGRISVNKFPKGIYIVKIYSDNEVLSSKFIKN